jgi:hypothetical protein
MTIEAEILIRETREWIASLARLESPESEHTLRLAIIAGPGPNTVYTLLYYEEPETVDTEAKLETFPTLGESVEAMKNVVRNLTHHGWRFVVNFYEC